MNTAVNMEAKPIHVNIASLPNVRILATSAVQSAATIVHTTVHALPPAKILRPWAKPMNPEPLANL